jgi:lipopolysaccharide/colanic/teichoic acid biosynthesis glycosyltransferase
MGKRPIEIAVATVALLLASPLCVAAAVGIWLSDGRPVLYKSSRVGLRGRLFTMYKFRTMRTGAKSGVVITASGDDRIFPFGAWLRRSKIDEVPQLINVVRGDMSIIGPRPEDPAIVASCYGPLAHETLSVRPGLASPGSIYNFTHGEHQLGDVEVESAYIGWLLPRKLALDLLYVRRASWFYDIEIMMRAAGTIAARVCGRRRFPDPREVFQTRQIELDMDQEIRRRRSGAGFASQGQTSADAVPDRSAAPRRVSDGESIHA